MSIPRDQTFGLFSVAVAGDTVNLDGYSSKAVADTCEFAWYKNGLSLATHTVTVLTLGQSPQDNSNSYGGTFTLSEFL